MGNFASFVKIFLGSYFGKGIEQLNLFMGIIFSLFTFYFLLLPCSVN
jgi:hypothetical protein